MSRASLTVAVLLATSLGVVATACPKPQPKASRDAGKDAGAGGGAMNAATGPGQATLFFTGDMRGEIEPCGCNSNPLGDLSRLAALVEDAAAKQGKGAVVWLDAGSTLYGEATLSDNRRDQERLKAQLIIGLANKLGLAGAGLGRFDLADGKDKIGPARQAANVGADQGVALEAPKVIDVGGVKVGVFGLANPEDLADKGVKATDPSESAKKVASELRKQGAQVVVALTQLDARGAKELARKNLGIDFVVVGKDGPDPSENGGQAGKGIEKAGDAYVIAPARKGQSVVRVDVHTDPAHPGPLVDAFGEERAQGRIEDLKKLMADQEQQLAAWKKDASADPKFLEQQQKMLDDWKKESAELAANPLRKPEAGSWFTGAHVLVQRKLRCAPDVVAAKRAFDKAAAEKNLAAAAGEKPQPVPAGGSGYAGIDECEMCHKKAVDFWKKTRHAHAWETLVKVGKDVNRDCIRCHVAGWEKPGGATLLGVTKEPTLRDVQCESCHGPGGRHVDSDGKERTTLVRVPPETQCKGCHEPAHSDTFDYQAYLRDVTGPGHGDKFRKKLGDGPTGHALRSAALAKAAQAIGEGCDK